MKPYPQRKSPRLQGYDYTQSGAYFVTICADQRQYLFGRVEEGVMILSDAGNIVSARWFALPEHHSHIELDAFVVMPNHIHGIILLIDHGDPVGTMPALSAPKLSTIIGSFKSSVTRHIRHANSDYHNMTIWQARYHDHIIRNEPDLIRIREYVQNNPALWEADTFYE